MAPPPSPLVEELIEEILIRFPPDDPASLVGAALVCKPWCRLVCSPGFSRRFTEFQRRRRTPVLGFFCHVRPRQASSEELRFVATSPSFRCLPHAMTPNWQVVDAVHGRVLFCDAVAGDGLRFTVTGRQTSTMRPPMAPQPYKGWKAALLSVDSDSDSFGLVFVATMADGVTSARVYSSEQNAWGMPVLLPSTTTTSTATVATTRKQQQRQRVCVSTLGRVVVRRINTNNNNTAALVYFECRWNYGILEYDSCKQQLSFIGLPSLCENKYITLMTDEDGGLGFAMIDVHRDSKLFTWSRRDDDGDDASADPSSCSTWTQQREFDLDELFPSDVLFTPLATATRVVAVVNAFTDVFIGTVHGIFTVDLNLGQVRQIHHSSHPCDIRQIVPYTTFCTPVVGNGLCPR